MPSSPKIPKEIILETALQMLIRDGYSTINIKTVAAELGCSTQPISRHFGNMDGFRKELLEYSVAYLKKIFQIKENDALSIVFGIAQGYINLAYDYPNLYKYLYMSEQDGEHIGDVARSLRDGNHNKVTEMLAREYNLTLNEASYYMRNMDFYVHGIASYVAVGFMDASKQEVMERILAASKAFLMQAKSMQE